MLLKGVLVEEKTRRLTKGLYIFMPIKDSMAFIDILSYIWDVFLIWLTIFIAPLENLNMLWITLPVILNWIFTEFYQEKKGTSLGNAISNGVVALLVGIDWLRQSTNIFTAGNITIPIFISYAVISILMVIYGIAIIVWGIKLSKKAKYFGRIREVTYITLMFTPIVYGIIPLSLKIIITIFAFFPIFYFFFEVLDWIIPDPKVYNEEENEKGYKDKMFSDIEKEQPINPINSNFDTRISNQMGNQMNNPINNNQQNNFQQPRF